MSGVAGLATLLRRGILKGFVLLASKSPATDCHLEFSPLSHCCYVRGGLGFPSLLSFSSVYQSPIGDIQTLVTADQSGEQPGFQCLLRGCLVVSEV